MTKKKGFLGKLFEKMDKKMEKKAKEKGCCDSEESCCK